MTWVQATASFGFLEAYAAFVRPMSDDERDRLYAEAAPAAPAAPAATLYGAAGAPRSLAQQRAQFAAMLSKLERSDIIFDFLDILRRTPILPVPLQPLQGALIRAAVEIAPPEVRGRLSLDASFGLRLGEGAMIRFAARLAERLTIASTPSAQACRRLGLPTNYLQLQT